MGAPPSAALSAAAVRPARLGAPSAASITGAPRLATSIGVTPLASKLPPPSATLSATVAPRLATSVGMARAPSLSAKFAPPSATLNSTVAPRLATSIGAGVGMARAPTLSAKLAAPSASLSSAVTPALATSIGAGVGMARAPRLQGVDLRLDQFDLSEATHMSPEEQESGWVTDVKPLDECVAIGDVFFDCLDGSTDLLKEDDRSLLQSIFHPALSDRRQEGDLFMPPSARHAYVQKLRALVKDEQCVRSKRKETFFSQDFKMSEPGSLFPLSWKPSLKIAECLRATNDVVMKPCSEYQGQEQAILDRIAKTTY